MRDIFVDNLLKFAVKDKNIFFLTADLGFGSFDVLERKLKDRYINVGVSEQNMIGIAAGLARERKKVITYSIANFAFMRCLEQIRNDAAYHDCNVTIIANGAGFSYGQLGMSHHATEDIAIMSSIPNVKVHSPATKNDIEYLLKNSLKSDCVNYLRLDNVNLRKIKKDKNFNLITFSVSDKYSDSGIIAAVILEKRNSFFQIKEFLISCRALGRNLEYIFISQIIKNFSIKDLRICYLKTERNEPFIKFAEKIKLKKNIKNYLINIDMINKFVSKYEKFIKIKIN